MRGPHAADAIVRAVDARWTRLTIAGDGAWGCGDRDTFAVISLIRAVDAKLDQAAPAVDRTRPSVQSLQRRKGLP